MLPLSKDRFEVLILGMVGRQDKLKRCSMCVPKEHTTSMSIGVVSRSVCAVQIGR